MSHVERGGATHTRVTPFKIAWLILGNKKCGGTDRIDVTHDIHVKVSRTSVYDATQKVKNLEISVHFSKKKLKGPKFKKNHRFCGIVHIM
jgi:hypothetical protein